MAKSGIQLDMEAWGNLIASIYESALNPDKWADTLNCIGKPINSHVNHLVNLSEQACFAYLGCPDGSGAEMQSAFEFESSIGIQPRVEHGLSLPAMTFYSEPHYIDEKTMEKHPYFCTESGKRYEAYYSGCSTLINTSGHFAGIGNIRPKKYGAFSDTEIQYCKSVGVHVRRSLELMQLHRIQLLTGSTISHLDEFSTGVVALDAEASIVGLNSKASEILKRRDGIHDLNKRVVLSSPNAQKQLNRALAILVGYTAINAGAPRYIAVQRSNGQPPYYLLVAPLTSKADRVAGLYGIICIIDSDDRLPDVKNTLKELYKLTPAEAELVEALCHNISLSEYAEQHSLSKETPKYHLKHIFEKTDTRRQSELVSLVSTKVRKLAKLRELSTKL